MLTMATNSAATGASSASSAPNNSPATEQQWSLIDIVEFCNKANLSGIQFQSASMELMNKRMMGERLFQNDCDERTSSAQATAKTMENFNIAAAAISAALIPLAIVASFFAGPEVLGLDLSSLVASGSFTSAIDVTSGASSLACGTGLSVTQAQFGQAQKEIQIDRGAIENVGTQIKQLGNILTSITKEGQSQGGMVSTCINNTAQAETAYKHRE